MFVMFLLSQIEKEMKNFGHAVKSIIIGYYHVLFGYGVRLTETDKQILEMVADSNPSLSEFSLGNLNDLRKLNKLVNADYLKRTTGPLSQSQGCNYYIITSKGIEYLEYPPSSRTERIVILLAFFGAVFAFISIAATIIIGVLTSHNLTSHK